MNTNSLVKRVVEKNRHALFLNPWPVVLASLFLGAQCGSTAAERVQQTETFATPQEAVASFTAAVKAQSQDALRSIFGAAVETMENPDRVQATNEYNAVGAALDQGHRLVRESDTKYVLEMGTNQWPFPIPIIQQNSRWYFDTAAGKEELLNRRIGKNELEVLEVMRAYVDAQREYATRDRDGDEVLEYAQRLASSPGTQDGLYWPPDMGEEASPLGPFVAQAQAEGYFSETPGSKASPEPFHGYLFRILTRQGKHAPGGKYDYVINGNMIGGFAMIAWPAEYGASGVMTFIVNQQGRVYQKDLGEKTAKLVRKIDAYDPDPSWELSRE